MSTIIPDSEEEGGRTGTTDSAASRQLENYHQKKKTFAIRAAIAGSLGHTVHFRTSSSDDHQPSVTYSTLISLIVDTPDLTQVDYYSDMILVSLAMRCHR